MSTADDARARADQDNAIEVALAQGHSQRAVAKLLGVDRNRVFRVARRLQQGAAPGAASASPAGAAAPSMVAGAATEESASARRLAQLERLARKVLPVAVRAELYASIARGEADPKLAFAQLGALKRLDEWEGIVTAKERKEAELARPQPLFVLPEGTRVRLTPEASPSEPVREAAPPTAEPDADGGEASQAASEGEGQGGGPPD